MVCKKCGYQAGAGDAFCSKCGSKIENVSEPVVGKNSTKEESDKKIKSKARIFPGGSECTQSVVKAVKDCLTAENFETQVIQQYDNYIIQGKKDGALLKTFGVDKAVTVNVMKDNHDLIVEIGRGKWLSKAVGASIGMAIFLPALLTAGFGIISQMMLFSKIESKIDQVIARAID
jgi:ABC-type antimicrobial peptide transport system permease subunit